MSEQPSAVSLFSGAGGLDVGIERAGWNVVSANDFDSDCIETLELNQRRRVPVEGSMDQIHLAGTEIVAGPVERLSAADFRPTGAGSRWTPDLLIGGPPCQPFSSAGAQRSIDDPRGRLFEHFVRLATELSPRFILFENVRGLVTARGGEGQPGEVLALVRESFHESGYATNFALLNAADFGSPQRRVRLFMLGSRESSLPVFPTPTHSRDGIASLDGVGRKAWVTLGDFLADREGPADGEFVYPTTELMAKLRDVPEGSGLKSPGRAEPTRPGGHWGYRQGTFIADQALPARTVTAAATQDWIRLPDGRLRRLTLRECASLQGFPEEWEFVGALGSQFRQVGNAVPSIFGEVLGGALMSALLDNSSGGRTKAVSAPFPKYMHAAIEYTSRDDHRNGHVRPRSPRYGAR